MWVKCCLINNETGNTLSLETHILIQFASISPHDEVALPTTLTPGIFNSCSCFLPFRILYSIVLKSDLLTVAACLRNSLLAYDVLLDVVSNSFIVCCGCSANFLSFDAASRNICRYSCRTSFCKPDIRDASTIVELAQTQCCSLGDLGIWKRDLIC